MTIRTVSRSYLTSAIKKRGKATKYPFGKLNVGEGFAIEGDFRLKPTQIAASKFKAKSRGNFGYKTVYGEDGVHYIFRTH